MLLTIWLILGLIMLVVEIFTTALVSIWFLTGALVAALLAYLNLALWIQVVAFVLVSFLAFLAVRPFARKHVNANVERTNVDSLIGETGIVTQTIDNIHGLGMVNLRGQSWTARSLRDAIVIPEGAQVEVKEIRGVRLIVVEKETIPG